jgi:hypothetical protein
LNQNPIFEMAYSKMILRAAFEYLGIHLLKGGSLKNSRWLIRI